MLDITKSWVSRSLDHHRPLTCCAVSPDGRFVAAGGMEESVLVWELATGTKTSLAAHRSWITAVAFHPDNARLFSADCHGAIHCWPLTEANARPRWSQPKAVAAADVPRSARGWIRAMLVGPDGNLLTAGNDRVIRMWSADSGELLREMPSHESYIFSLALHPDGKTLASGDLLGRVHLWDYATGERRRTLDAGPLHTRGEDFLADVGGVRSLAFDREGRWLAAGGMTDAKSNTFCPGSPAVLVFDFTSGELKHTLRPRQASDGPINSLVFLSDGTLAGHAEHLNGQSSLEFWKPDQPQSLHVLPRQSGFCLAAHPDGLQLAAATFKPNGRGGNGRHSEPAEYASHHGEISLISLYAKPG